MCLSGGTAPSPPPTHHVLLLADWLEPFLETEAAEINLTKPTPRAALKAIHTSNQLQDDFSPSELTLPPP